MSHLLQMRGLKPHWKKDKEVRDKSHLLQMRGLKQFEPSYIPCVLDVASFTDAWIETIPYH